MGTPLKKNCIGNTTIWLKDYHGNDVYKVAFNKFEVTTIMDSINIDDPIRMLEAIDLLAANGHIKAIKNENLKEYGVFCNKDGERARHEGLYIKKAISSSFKLVSGIVVTISALIFGLIKLVGIFL